jgi:hypothetical protein
MPKAPKIKIAAHAINVQQISIKIKRLHPLFLFRMCDRLMKGVATQAPFL